MILDFDRRDDLYLLVFKINFKLLSDQRIKILKRSKVLVTADEYILVLADKYNAGLIINELLEENLISVYPNVSLFRILFDISVIRSPGILYRLSAKLEETPVLGFFTLGPEVYLVVRRQDADKVEEALVELFEKRSEDHLIDSVIELFGVLLILFEPPPKLIHELL